MNQQIMYALEEEVIKENSCQMTFSSPVATAEFSKFAGILSAAL